MSERIRNGEDRRTHARSILSAAIGPVVIERLEARRFLSISCSFNSLTHALTVDGTTADERIDIQTDSGTLKVQENFADVWTHAESDVNSIVVNAGAGNDTVVVNGDDLPVASRIAITLNGGAGNDSLQGGAGADTLYGDDGSDTLKGGAGNDVLNGGNGDDILYGQAGNDQMNGQAGNDELWAESTADGADTLSGGTEYDTARYDPRSANLVVSLDGTANDGESGEGDNVQADIETVIGGSGNDSITGSSGANRIEGGGSGKGVIRPY